MHRNIHFSHWHPSIPQEGKIANVQSRAAEDGEQNALRLHPPPTPCPAVGCHPLQTRGLARSSQAPVSFLHLNFLGRRLLAAGGRGWPGGESVQGGPPACGPRCSASRDKTVGSLMTRFRTEPHRVSPVAGTGTGAPPGSRQVAPGWQPLRDPAAAPCVPAPRPSQRRRPRSWGVLKPRRRPHAARGGWHT